MYSIILQCNIISLLLYHIIGNNFLDMPLNHFFCNSVDLYDIIKCMNVM